ncbi:MAG TPA: hypothetical protein VEJ16_09605, partial [Alphaproteobacteria bacterium]|nr:hypothetical protein [Alphaproteobacteria bacterium]
SVGAAISADPNAGTVAIAADGSIAETPGGFVSASALALSSGVGIGTSGAAFDISARHVSAVNMGVGGIDIANSLASGATATFSNVETMAGDITIAQTGGNLALGNAATDVSGNLTVEVAGGGNLSATDLTTHGGGDVTLDASAHGNILLNGAVNATGSVIAKADDDLTLMGATIASGGQVTLVADNQAPSSPNIGSGQFIVNGVASISTVSGDGIGIFTARSSQNQIDGSLTLNGIALASQPKVAIFDTWFSPSIAFGSSPFTIFFKDSTMNAPPPSVETPATAMTAPFTLPPSFEDTSVLTQSDDLIFGQNSFPVAFGILYGQGASKPDGFMIQASSFDIVPDSFSTLSRKVFLDLQNPATELQGIEIEAATKADNVLERGYSGGGGSDDAISCAELQSVLPVLNSSTAEKNYQESCESARANDAPELRNQHFYRPVLR